MAGVVYNLEDVPGTAGVQFAAETDTASSLVWPTSENPPWYDITIAPTVGFFSVNLGGAGAANISAGEIWRATCKLGTLTFTPIAVTGYISWARQ